MQSLLPDGSGLFEKAFEQVWAERWPSLELGADAIRGAKFDPPPAFLPFLVFEYGLGELTPYVPNLYTLVVDREGVNWQRIRGTPASVYKGLGWLGYTATLEDAWHGRVYWNSTQLRFPELPRQDFPDLERIEGITRLSLPKRSQLRRGVHQYDVTALVADGGRLDNAMLERESGVAVTSAGTLWSFGRTTEVEHVMTEAEGTAIGNWLDVPQQGGIKWVSMDYPWVTATFPWAGNPALQRQSLLASWFTGKPLFATLRDVDGEILGHRRCRATHTVSQRFDGAYSFGAVRYEPVAAGARLYVEALTNFGDASDVTASSVELTVGAELADGVKPGRLWLQAGELVGGNPIAVTPVTLPLRSTVREQIKFLLRFDNPPKPAVNFARASNSQYLPLILET
ncbi:MAG TPA: phage tail protein [Pseudorhizobium sp.]|nr:phage tail protein [Pseudorhizobium sp.]